MSMIAVAKRIGVTYQRVQQILNRLGESRHTQTHKVDASAKEEIVGMYESGMTMRQVAARMGLSYGTVHHHLRGVPKHRKSADVTFHIERIRAYCIAIGYVPATTVFQRDRALRSSYNAVDRSGRSPARLLCEIAESENLPRVFSGKRGAGVSRHFASSHMELTKRGVPPRDRIRTSERSLSAAERREGRSLSLAAATGAEGDRTSSPSNITKGSTP
jgi:transcriptional regulator with XRE-family HTH domain